MVDTVVKGDLGAKGLEGDLQGGSEKGFPSSCQGAAGGRAGVLREGCGHALWSQTGWRWNLPGHFRVSC